MDGIVSEMVRKMTLEEKAGMCSGANWFETKSVERLGIPRIQMFDGPNGLRKNSGKSESDSLGSYRAVESTCFPTGSAMAASWDEELLFKIGQYMGQECLAEQVPLLLGPAVNIKRSPLCGRNFEYLTEDPYLCGKLAAALVKGVQSKGVGACLKHFAANSQEEKRLSVNSIIDERTLREIYLTGFEIAVKESDPWTVMCAYNKVNGKHCSRNEHLLDEILRREWGFKGFVMTDWGAMKDRVDSLRAGLELEMPASGEENDRAIVEAVKRGELEESVLDRAVERILQVVLRASRAVDGEAVYDREAHNDFASEAAADCMVLLKNDGNLLPLKKGAGICVLGEMAEKTRYQGGGSSHVTTGREASVLKELVGKGVRLSYAKGYSLEGGQEEGLLREAVELAAKSETVVIVAGLPDSSETESRDRVSMKMPKSHTDLIMEAAKVNRNVVVVLLNGAPVEMSWETQVCGILEAYLGGQASAKAIADILCGDVNPSGKLAETFPVKLQDNPSYLNYGMDTYEVDYREGIYVGYRYYDKKEMNVRYPFGYGLSYTAFSYGEASVDKNEIREGETIKISLKIRNTGKVYGKEVVQLYVEPEDARNRPLRELKGFRKIALMPGEEKEVCFTIGERDLSYYSMELGDWHVKDGKYTLCVGSSSRDIRQRCEIRAVSFEGIPAVICEDTVIGDLLRDERYAGILEEMLETYAPEIQKKRDGIFDNMPLRQAKLFSKGSLTWETLQSYIDKLNHATGGRELF